MNTQARKNNGKRRFEVAVRLAVIVVLTASVLPATLSFANTEFVEGSSATATQGTASNGNGEDGLDGSTRATDGQDGSDVSADTPDRQASDASGGAPAGSPDGSGGVAAGGTPGSDGASSSGAPGTDGADGPDPHDQAGQGRSGTGSAQGGAATAAPGAGAGAAGGTAADGHDSERGPASSGSTFGQAFGDSVRTAIRPRGITTFAVDSDFVFDGAGTILDYLGTDKDPVIPQRLQGKPVTAIGERAFRNKGLTGVTLPNGLLIIGEGAFAENSLVDVTFSNTIRTIGRGAFAFNQLTSLELPASLSNNTGVSPAIPALGEYAFRGNRIGSIRTLATAAGQAATESWPNGVTGLPTGVFMDNRLAGDGIPASWNNIAELGDSAFELNLFTEVTIPSGMSAYGSRVFANNGRYVLVDTTNGLVQSYSVPDAFGEVRKDQLARVTLVCKDDSGNVLGAATEGVDLTKQVADASQLPLVGNSYPVTVPDFTGMCAIGASLGTLSADGTTLTVAITQTDMQVAITYQDTTGRPVIAGIDAITVQASAGGRLTKAQLLAGVTATSSGGADLTASLVIEKPLWANDLAGGDWYLDTAQPFAYRVKYTVDDPVNGTSTTAWRSVMVGSNILDMEIGNGWTYGDFEYDADVLKGFSAQGKTKIQDPARAAEVYLPEMNPHVQSRTVLRTVGEYAFKSDSSDIKWINFLRIAPNLYTIKQEAFEKYRSTQPLDFRSMTALRTIERDAFNKYDGPEVLFGSLPELTTIGNSAFRNYKGTNTTLDISGMTALRTIDGFSFASFEGSQIIFGSLPALTDIYWNAFEKFGSNVTTSLDFSGLTALKSIDGEAFKNYNGPELKLDNLGSLTQIGSYAFANYRGKTLDLTSLSSLNSIGRWAFWRYNGGDLRMNGLSSLEYIYESAFSSFIGNDNGVFDLSGSVSLKEIGAHAFDMLGGHTKTRNQKLILGQMPKLESIGGNAFTMWCGYKQTLDLSGMVSLKEIGVGAFQWFGLDYYISSPSTYAPDLDTRLVFGLSPNLQTIGKMAFRNYYNGGNQTFDLSMLTGLKDIGDHAFYLKDKSIIYLPAGRSMEPLVLQADSFAYFNQPTGTDCSYYAFTPAGATPYVSLNPNQYVNAMDSTITGTLYLNQLLVTVVAKHNGAEISRGQVPLSGGFSSVGTQIDVPALSIPGFSPTQASKRVTVASLTGTVVEFDYTKNSSTSPGAFHLKLANVPDGTPPKNGVYPIGEDMKLQVIITTSGSGATVLPEDYSLVIPLTRFSTSVNVANSPAIKSWRYEGGNLVIVFSQQYIGSGSLSFEFSQQYRAPETPWGFTAEFGGWLVDDSNGIVYEFPQTGDGAKPTLQGTGNGQPYLRKMVNGEYRNGKDALVGTSVIDPNHPERARFVTPGTEEDVVFTWSVENTPKRLFTGYTLHDVLPSYLMRDTPIDDRNGGKRGYAGFDAAANPGWSAPVWVPAALGSAEDLLDGWANGGYYRVSYTGALGTPSQQVSLGGVSLRLRFPEARVYEVQGVRNESTITLDVYHDPSVTSLPGNVYPATDPAVREGSGGIDLTLVAEHTTSGIYYKKSVGLHGTTNFPYFYDEPEERSQEFRWYLHFENNGGDPFTDVHYRDYELDDCLYYYGVKNLAAAEGRGMRVVAYDAQGQVLSDEQWADEVYRLPSSIPQGAVKGIEVFMLNGFEVRAGQSKGIEVLTKVRTGIFESPMYNQPNPINNHVHHGQSLAFVNRSIGTMTQGGKAVDVPMDNQMFIMGEVNELGIEKKATIQGKSGSIVVSGDYITYMLSLYGERSQSARTTDFKAVDLLPEAVDLVSVTPGALLNGSLNPDIQVAYNYNGSGRTAVIVTADELLVSAAGSFGGELASIRTQRTPMNGNQGYFTNDVYMRADGLTSLRGRLQPSTAAMGDNLPNAHSSVTLNSLRSSIFTIIKQIGPEGGPYTRDGIDTAPGAAFQYRYNIYNPDDSTWRDHVVIYDVFPFLGDLMMDPHPVTGAARARDSRFSNTLRRLLDPAQFPAGTQIYYTTDTPDNSRSFVNTASHWKTAAVLGLSNGDRTGLARVNGFKVVMPDSWRIAADSSFSFTADMYAPSDPTRALVGQRAWNSFAVTDNVIVQNGMAHDPVESNRVWNAMEGPKADVLVKKTADDGTTPLPGAVMALVDASSNLTVQTKASDTNGLVLFTDVPLGDYYIKEVKAPAGYILSNERRDIARNELDQAVSAGSGTLDKGVYRNSATPAPVEAGTIVVRKEGAAGPLAGALFKVTGPDYPTDASLSLQRFTNAAGSATFDQLPLGTWHLEEVRAPGHLVASFQGIDLDLTYDGEVLAFPNQGAIPNTTAELDLVKIGIYDDALKARPNHQLDASFGRKMAGIEFKLFQGSAQGYAANPGAAAPATGATLAPSDGRTDSSGRLHIGDLAAGQHYTLVEAASPVGLTMRNGQYGAGVYDVMVDGAGALFLDGQKVDTADLVIGNDGDANQFLAVLTKVDQDGKPLAGAEFLLQAWDGYWQRGYDFHITTGADGTITVANDPNGNGLVVVPQATPNMGNIPATTRPFDRVTLTEVNAPDGYAMQSPAPVFEFFLGNGYQDMTIV
ncbi:MAG: leucine-rich repeat protein, partial [Coriobacteriaceae bacterium]|nr:leucine-rich repeat protein [Coriobacteriaceae bacterium]